VTVGPVDQLVCIISTNNVKLCRFFLAISGLIFRLEGVFNKAATLGFLHFSLTIEASRSHAGRIVKSLLFASSWALNWPSSSATSLAEKSPLH